MHGARKAAILILMDLVTYKEYLAKVYTTDKGEHLSKSSINHYANESLRFINKSIERLTDGNVTAITEIDTLSELLKIQRILNEDEIFSETNRKGHQMYSAGLNRYIEFAKGTRFHARAEATSLIDVPLPPHYAEKSLRNTIFPTRDRIKVIQSAEACSFRCQINPTHKTFIMETSGNPYCEGHHIIALSKQSEFNYSLDCYANIIILCPTCHRFFHYGSKQEKEKLLYKIYEERSEQFEHAGLTLSLKEFIKETL